MGGPPSRINWKFQTEINSHEIQVNVDVSVCVCVCYLFSWVRWSSLSSWHVPVATKHLSQDRIVRLLGYPNLQEHKQTSTLVMNVTSLFSIFTSNLKFFFLFHLTSHRASLVPITCHGHIHWGNLGHRVKINNNKLVYIKGSRRKKVIQTQ